MKKKRFDKKLTLNKTTLTNLDLEKMREVYGAYGTDFPQWRTIEKICQIYSCVVCTWVQICEGTYDCY